MSQRVRRLLLLTLNLVATASACDRALPGRVESPADTAAGEIPFRLAGPNEAALVVEIHLNGQGPFDFVLDTGATFTCVDQDLAEQVALERGSGIAQGLTIGGAGQVQIVRIDSLRIGQTTAHDLLGCTMQLDQLQQLPGLEAQGLLGLNFLKSFRVTLDFERNVLQLDPTR